MERLRALGATGTVLRQRGILRRLSTLLKQEAGNVENAARAFLEGHGEVRTAHEAADNRNCAK